jgi:ribosomal-protein-alanine N-acetyltransferase
MEDWPEWAELRARSRAFLTPWEPTWPDDSLGRDHFRRRLRQQVREWRAARPTACSSSSTTAPAGRRHQSQQRAPRRRPGASVGYWMGQPYAGQGLMTDALARHPAVRVRRAAPAPARGGLPAAQRAVQGGAGQGRLPRGGLARQYLRINGQWADHLLFALLRADYDAS